MEYNFNEYLDEIVLPAAMLAPDKRERERPAFTLKPHIFAIGSVQGPIFREGFSRPVDHSAVNLYFEDQALFFRISFEDEFPDWPKLQATVPLDGIESVQLIKTSPISGKLIMTLRRPPPLEADFRGTPDDRAIGIRRATELDWFPDYLKERDSGAPSTLPRGWRISSPMKFGLWLTYSFDFFCSSSSDLKRVSVALSRLRAIPRLGVEHIAVDPDLEPHSTTVLPAPGREDWSEGSENDVFDVDTFLEHEHYPFNARYLLTGLVSQGLLLPMEVPDVVHRLWPLSLYTRVLALRALFRLQRRQLVGAGAPAQIERLKRHLPSGAPTLSLKQRKEQQMRSVAVRRAVVTPTRVLLFPEMFETGNRVLRAWPREMADGRFIRVGFADEDGRMRVGKRIVQAERVDPDGGLLARIRNVLKSGVYVAGRHYVFLAAGESQLKDHSCWMVCEEGNFTADRVRAQMGDFSKEQVVAKYAARMGLCLSATRPVAELTESDIEPLPDVEHGSYTFTDGVGNCSQQLASLCARALGSDEKAPSAVQIRMGGIKGVLSVHPHLQKNEVCIRPSMEKFPSPLRGLGVMKVSRFAPAHLNRQAICVMEGLGFDITALLNLFKLQIQRAENLEKDFELLNLNTKAGGRHPARHIYKNAAIPIAKMVKAGLKDQLLLKNVLRCVKCQLLRDLKYKARVLINEGAYLMGIADEYDVLEEGQIYCAVTPNGGNSRRVITGQCTIFRSPCVHPGDARLVTAVDHPAYQDHPLTNVVVFSTKEAARDLPSMLGGGDLDGDFFTVIYDKQLQITREHEPMDYTAVPPMKKDKVEMADICDFVVEYIRSDVLGIVSSMFQAVADHRGPDHPYCLELAKRSSDAVDFAKSGVPVQIPDYLRPQRYPDFMDRGAWQTYKSTRVLGMMYRLIEPAPQYEPSTEICIDTRITSRRVVTTYLKAAGEMKQNYDVDMEGLMRQHNLCEAEIIAGVSVMSDQRRRRAADDAIRGPVREGMEAMRVQYRREARRFVKANPSGGGLETWGIACYQVTHVEEHRSRWVDALNHSRRGSAAVSDDGTEEGEYTEVTRRELISFPWLWAQEICNALEDAVIKEEDEEDEELGWGWKNPWENDSDSDSEEEEQEVKQEILED